MALSINFGKSGILFNISAEVLIALSIFALGPFKFLIQSSKIGLETSQMLVSGYNFIGPVSGEMACGEYGEGKMSSPRQIFSFLEKYFKDRNLVKKNKISALVTTGPTKEYLDPVRFISNESSGKQGYEIALALSKLGVKTTLIAGPSKINFSIWGKH